MNLIRQFLYETILIAIVVIVCPVLLLVGMSSGSVAQENREEIATLFNQARTVQGVSEAQLKVKKENVEKIKKSAKEVDDRALEENRENFDVLQVEVGVDNTQQFPMFPWDRTRSIELDAWRAVRSAFDRIKSDPAFTRPPYVEFIQDEYEKRLARLTLINDRKRALLAPEEEDEGRRPGRFGPDRSGRRSGGDLELEEGKENVFVTEDGQEIVILTPTQLETRAKREALFRYALQSARGGMLYIDDEAFSRNRPGLDLGSDRRDRDTRYEGFDFQLGEDPSDAPSELQGMLLWREQVRLWVCKDVVNAILETNRDHVRKMAQSSDLPIEQSVLTAPIKRLVWIDCTGEFYTGFPVDETRERVIDERDWGPEGPPEDFFEQTTMPEARTITGDVSNKEYDIVRYRFVVVMNPGQIGMLQRNLARRNYHSVLGLKAEAAENSLQMPGVRDRRNRRDERTQEPTLTRSDVRYYGAEPVMQVTFDVQLRLLTEWVRGMPIDPLPRVEEDDNPEQVLFQPDAQPLVPWRVLNAPDIDYALREVDQKRVEIHRKQEGIADPEEEGRR